MSLRQGEYLNKELEDFVFVFYVLLTLVAQGSSPKSNYSK